MKIELKNIKHAEFASRETHCFTASVYIDGKRSGTVSNDGHGGCNGYEPRSLALVINDYAKTLPPLPSPFADYDEPIEQSEDTLIGELVNQYVIKKQEKQWCKNATLVRFEGEEYHDSWRRFKVKYYPELITKLEKQVGKKVSQCLNQELIA